MRTPRKKVSFRFSFLKSVNKVLLMSTIAAVLLTGIVALILASQTKFNDSTLAILVLVNVLLISLPVVLFILCIISSALFNSDLSKKKIAVNKLTRFESLFKINTLCLEKENVIADNTFTIKKVIPLQTVATEQYIDQWLSNMLRATNDNSPVFDTLNKKYDLELSAGVVSVLHYNDELKYNGASFKGGKTIVLGSPEFAPIKNKVGILKRCEEDINKGHRVLVLAEGKEQIGDGGYPGELEAIALIVLKDHIREGAFETFKWFKDNNVDIKVVSSDNPLVTSVDAIEIGIENADKYISIEGMTTSEIEKIISQYTVFGYATAEQKETIVAAIKKNKKVMMIGGNETSVLPMRAANFAVAMVDSDDRTKKAADIILESPSLETLSIAINDSKAFINNSRKILSLSLAKSALAFVLVLLFVVFNNNLKQCLFVFNHFLLWDLLTNGVATFFLTLDKNNKSKIYGFIKKSIPMMILQIMGVISMFILYALQSNNLFSVDLYTIDNIAVVCVLMFAIFGVVSLYSVCSPLIKQRRTAFAIGVLLNVLSVAVIMLIAYLSDIESPYKEMGGPAYFVAAIAATLYSAIYLFFSRIISIFKGDSLEDEN